MEKVKLGQLTNIKTGRLDVNAENPNGAILEIEAPIHVSNVQVLDKNGVAGRVGYKEVDGKKVRFNKKSGEVLD